MAENLGWISGHLVLCSFVWLKTRTIIRTEWTICPLFWLETWAEYLDPVHFVLWFGWNLGWISGPRVLLSYGLVKTWAEYLDLVYFVLWFGWNPDWISGPRVLCPLVWLKSGLNIWTQVYYLSFRWLETWAEYLDPVYFVLLFWLKPGLNIWTPCTLSFWFGWNLGWISGPRVLCPFGLAETWAEYLDPMYYLSFRVLETQANIWTQLSFYPLVWLETRTSPRMTRKTEPIPLSNDKIKFALTKLPLVFAPTKLAANWFTAEKVAHCDTGYPRLNIYRLCNDQDRAVIQSLSLRLLSVSFSVCLSITLCPSPPPLFSASVSAGGLSVSVCLSLSSHPTYPQTALSG